MRKNVSSEAKVHDSVNIDDSVYIYGNVTIEEGCVIGKGCIIGGEPQHKTLGSSPDGAIIIKKGAVLREYCTVHKPIESNTVIGERCYIMNHSSIGHDVVLGSDVTVTNGAQIGGHCVIDDGATLGMNCAIHQRVFVGAYSMIGMCTPIKKNVLPFSMIDQNKTGINYIGISRNKFGHLSQTIRNANKMMCFDDALKDKTISKYYIKFIESER